MIRQTILSRAVTRAMRPSGRAAPKRPLDEQEDLTISAASDPHV